MDPATEHTEHTAHVDPTPMFPLGSVLLPGMSLSLRIFEDRYQRMLTDLLAGDRTFGVVLIERGNEVGGGEVRTDVGTLARLVEHRSLGGGHHTIRADGIERIKVDSWLEDDPYPRAAVSLWPDPDRDDDSPEVVAAYGSCTLAVRRLLEAAARAGHRLAPPGFETLDDPWQGTYLLAVLTSLGPFDQHRLLRTPTMRGRLDLLMELVEDQMFLLTGGDSG